MQTIYFSSVWNRALDKLEHVRQGAWISLVGPTISELEEDLNELLAALQP